MASIVRPEPQLRAAPRDLRYAPVLAAAFVTLAILALYADTALSMEAIWRRSETFAHGYLVVPIALWLAWRERHRLETTAARPWLHALAVVAAAGAVWVSMMLAEVISARQLALVIMIQAAIIAVVGTAVARAAALPLLFLLFAVPAGEFMLPTLIDWTADFTVAALRVSGVPVFREGNYFVIPSGSWSVVEACSGLRYLIASVMVGVVFAAVSYRTTWRRLAFFALSILVPLVANWIRAYSIVMIGHLSDNRLAVGVDHLIYGWVFFGVVMALLFWIGSFWSEPEAARPSASLAPIPPRPAATSPSRLFGAAVLAIAVAAIWRPVLALVDDDASSAAPASVTPIAAARGFVAAEPQRVPPFTPSYTGQSFTLRQAFVNASGDASGLYVAYYRDQAKGRELVTTANQLVASKDAAWKELVRARALVQVDGRNVEAERTVLSGTTGRVIVYRLYWIDGVPTVGDVETKARLAWAKLSGRGDDAALVVFFASENERGDVAKEALQAHLPQLLKALDQARAVR